MDRLQALSAQLGIEQEQSREEWLASKLAACGVQWEVVAANDGPQVTTYHVNRANGELFNKAKRDRVVAALGEEIHQSGKVSLATSEMAHFSLVLPRDDREYVCLSDIATAKNEYSQAVLGVSTDNKPLTLDIKTAPHVLIAGQTGGGKSVLFNTIIQSLMLGNTPDTLLFHLVDTGRVEFCQYENNPFVEAISYTVADAMADLDKAITEMEGRYKILQHMGVTSVYDIEDDSVRKYMPTIIVAIDEFADMMESSPDAKSLLEKKMQRISQIGRKAGIHLIVATQSPRASVISGVIRASLPTIITTKITGQTEKRIVGILDATALLGKGDCIIRYNDERGEVRFQAAYT